MAEAAQIYTTYEEKKRRERQERARGAKVVWLEEPRPLFPASRLRVWGVATDAAPEVIATFGLARDAMGIAS